MNQLSIAEPEAFFTFPSEEKEARAQGCGSRCWLHWWPLSHALTFSTITQPCVVLGIRCIPLIIVQRIAQLMNVAAIGLVEQKCPRAIALSLRSRTTPQFAPPAIPLSVVWMPLHVGRLTLPIALWWTSFPRTLRVFVLDPATEIGVAALPSRAPSILEFRRFAHKTVLFLTAVPFAMPANAKTRDCVAERRRSATRLL